MRNLLSCVILLVLSIASSRADSAAGLEAYLAKDFRSRISKVEVGPDELRIDGTVAKGDRLAEVPMAEPRERKLIGKLQAAAGGPFSIRIPRRDGSRDRLVSGWQLVDASGGPVSYIHYADEVACQGKDLPEGKPKSKKGLGGWSAGPLPGELDELGIDSVTVNIMIHSLVSLTPAEGTVPFTWQGKTYYAQEKQLAGYDETFRQAEKRGAVVSVIVLVANPAKGGNDVVKLLGHPDAVAEAYFAMPNFTSADGVDLYGAILNLMAERWSKAGGPHGRVHHWIMHNEVDAGWEWTNAGEKEDIVYLEMYGRSMRLMELIARQYDPHSRPFISLTHHWADKGQARWYGSKRLLDLLARFNEAEGNFGWGVAYHPYPQSLLEPKTWNDDQATSGFYTKKITPKNIEVLDAYMRQPQFLDDGKVRPVQLSENGFNSKDYSEQVLAEQAAAMAYVWKKISKLPSITTWEYHNWVDNRHEGGLRIGLRKFPDEPGDPYGRKPIWQLYQALGTEQEDEACAPYLKVVGISSW
jgi:hypothetical protein